MQHFKKIFLLNLLSLLILPLAVFAADAPAKAIIVYVFTAPERCPPCKQMEPIIAEMKKEGFDVRVVHADTEDGKKGAQFYQVENIPSFIFLDDKLNEVSRLEGIIKKKDLIDRLIPPADYLEKPKPSTPNIVPPTENISVECSPIKGNPKNGYICVTEDGKKFTVNPSSISYKNIRDNPKGPFHAVFNQKEKKYSIEHAPAKPDKPNGSITGITELPSVPGDVVEGVECKLIPATKIKGEYYKCLKKDGTLLSFAGRSVEIPAKNKDLFNAIKNILEQNKTARFVYDIHKNEIIPPFSVPDTDIADTEDPVFKDPLKDTPKQYRRSIKSPKSIIVNDKDR